MYLMTQKHPKSVLFITLFYYSIYRFGIGEYGQVNEITTMKHRF